MIKAIKQKNKSKHKAGMWLTALGLCCCLLFTPFAKTGVKADSGQTIQANTAQSSFGDGLSERLYNMSSRYDGSRGQTYGSDTIISNTDSGLPNAPLTGNGNVGLVLGGSAVGQTINVGMNDFWQGTYYPNSLSGTKPLPVGSIGYTVVNEDSKHAAEVDLATTYQSVSDSGNSGSGPAFAVSGDYVSTARNGAFWQSKNPGDGAWLKLQFADPIEFQRFTVWNAGSCMYNAASGADLSDLKRTGIHYWNTYKFRIQISMDDVTWSDAFTVENNYQPIVDRDLPSKATAKYVRLFIDDASSSPRGNAEPARICKFSLFASPMNDPNLMPLLVNGNGDNNNPPIQASTNCVEIGDGGHIYTSSDLYMTVSGRTQHLGGYGTSGTGWFTDTYPNEERDYITYNLNKDTTFKSYQLYNGSASAPSVYGRGDLRGWVVETSQDGTTFNEVHRVSPPTDPKAPNWGGQPMINSFDIESDKLQYTRGVKKIRVRVVNIHGARALMSQFKIFAGTLSESGIDMTDRAVFYQNIRDGRIGTESSYKGQEYIADTLMSQEDTNGKNYIVTKFTNKSTEPMTFRYYTFAHRYDNPQSGQDAAVSDDNKTLYATQTTNTASPENLAWVAAATIAATIDGDSTEWVNSGKAVGSAYGEFTVPSGENVSVTAYVDGRQYFKDSLGVTYHNITAKQSPTKPAAVQLSKQGVAADITAQSDEWWKNFWLKSYVDISTADAGAEKYYYFAQYIVGCGTREDNVPMSLFGPWITSNTPAWAGCYTTDYNTYGPYMAVASSNREDLLKPLVRNALESWGGAGIGTGIGRDYGIKINDLHGLGNFKDKNGDRLFKNGVDGILSGVRSAPHGYCFDNAGFYGILFTSAYAAIPVMSYFDMTQGQGEVAPGVTLTKELEYEYLKDMMGLWEQLLYYEDGKYKVRNDAAWEDEANKSANAFTLAALHRFAGRLLEDAEALGITVDEEPRMAKWADIDANLEPYPSAMTADRKGVKRLSFSDTSESAGQGFVTVKGLSYNNPNVVTAQVFPVSNTGLYSDPKVKEMMRNSLTTIQAWSQMNAHPTIFSTAARIGYTEYSVEKDMVGFDNPNVKTLLDQYSKTCQSNMAANNISGLFDPLQLIDTCGGAQGLNDMLVQMSEGIITLFPAFPKDKDAKFVNLQLTGGVLVSADYDGTAGKVTKAEITAKFGGRQTIALPMGANWKIVDGNGNDVATSLSTVGTLVGIDAYNNIAAISFDTVANATYRIVEVTK